MHSLTRMEEGREEEEEEASRINYGTMRVCGLYFGTDSCLHRGLVEA